MDHFEREAYLQWLIPGTLLVVALLAGLIVTCALPVIREVRVDACLDSGGSYDYEADRCDPEASHPAP